MANEKRVRNNNVQGTLSSTMSAAGTTINSAGLANLEAISSTEHAAIVIDPGRTAGAPEIVYVTAHTGSATSATISRGKEGTAARAHSSTEDWVHAPTATIDYLPFRPPRVRVRTNAAETSTSGATHVVSWDVQDFDTDSMWSSTAATRIKFTTPGTYLVHCTMNWNDSADGGARQLLLRRNGGDFIDIDIVEPSTVAHRQSLTTLYEFTSTMYVEVVVSQNSGSPVAINAATTGSRTPNFWAIWQSS